MGLLQRLLRSCFHHDQCDQSRDSLYGAGLALSRQDQGGRESAADPGTKHRPELHSSVSPSSDSSRLSGRRTMGRSGLERASVLFRCLRQPSRDQGRLSPLDSGTTPLPAPVHSLCPGWLHLAGQGKIEYLVGLRSSRITSSPTEACRPILEHLDTGIMTGSTPHRLESASTCITRRCKDHAGGQARYILLGFSRF